MYVNDNFIIYNRLKLNNRYQITSCSLQTTTIELLFHYQKVKIKNSLNFKLIKRLIMLSINKLNELIVKIEADIYSEHQLNILYKNAVTNNYPEIQRVVQNALRKIGGSQYTKKFIKPIRAKIESLVHEIGEKNQWLAFDDNLVGQGVKVGGEMIRGDAIAQYYFSYKRFGWKKSLSFAVTQLDEQSEIYYSIGSPDFVDEVHVNNAEEAIRLFKNELNKIYISA